jgi:DNA primase small subunit
MTAAVAEVTNVYHRPDGIRSASTTRSDSHGDATEHQHENVVYSPELLSVYYARLFPYSLLHTWLSYGTRDPTVFAHREFSFTIEPVPGEEIYLRYQSFRNESELAAAVRQRRPTKIDIGAVFSHAPRDRAVVPTLRPVQRELVFDIDLTDYDDVRACGCTGARICPVCWGFMRTAVAVMDSVLRDDFGFGHVAWVYSGRRGIHAWVCDPAARELTDAARAAVASYCEIQLGSDQNQQVVLTHPLHPAIQRALQVLEPWFVEHVLPAQGHGLLATPAACDAFLQTIPDAAATVRAHLQTSWATRTHAPAEKWREVRTHFQIFLEKSASAKVRKTMSLPERERLETWTAGVVLRYSYPRLDINVSKMRNHLLKSPFCVHPKTGRVCVPIADIETFDPFAVPTLPQLVRELDEYHSTNASTSTPTSDSTTHPPTAGPDWQKTSLRAYLEPFQRNFLEPLGREIRRDEKQKAEAHAAIVGEF